MATWSPKAPRKIAATAGVSAISGTSTGPPRRLARPLRPAADRPRSCRCRSRRAARRRSALHARARSNRRAAVTCSVVRSTSEAVEALSPRGAVSRRRTDRARPLSMTTSHPSPAGHRARHSLQREGRERGPSGSPARIHAHRGVSLTAASAAPRRRQRRDPGRLEGGAAARRLSRAAASPSPGARHVVVARPRA